MKIVVAPNALKGSLCAVEAAHALAEGVRRAVPDAEIHEIPVADGGDGMAEVIRAARGGERVTQTVAGPRSDPVEAAFTLLKDEGYAAVEMATASGLALLKEEERDPLSTTTRGVGELIRAALDRGAHRLAIGLGGSATCDGGIGLAAALGVRFLDADDAPVRPVGGELERIERIDVSGLDPRVSEAEVTAVCDVDNPLLGPQGAAAVYAPQKGADAAGVQKLENGLARLAERIEADLGIDVRDRPGAGAAGGLGAGLVAFLGATLRPGIEIVFEAVGLADTMRGADLALTAEGQIDFQTVFGKAPAGVARAAREADAACLCLAGRVDPPLDKLHEAGMDAVFTLCPGPIGLDEAMREGRHYLADAAEQAVRAFLAGRRTVR